MFSPERDQEEVAKLPGITVTNSYKRISRAQAHLRLYLLDLHAGTEPRPPSKPKRGT